LVNTALVNTGAQTLRQALVPLALGLAIAAMPAAAGPSTPGEAQNVEMMAGCFAVSYEFVEDGIHDSLSPDYQLDEPITEWIELERRDDAALTLIHHSITEDGRAVPHFHEIWAPEPGGAGWTQEVWRWTPEDDRRELRYSCTAPWELNRWQCHAGPAAKPFRDAGAPFGFDRTDYDWLDRDNTVLVTENGWVHAQHNKKLDDDGELVSFELGWIVYRRVDPQQCDVAR
jgi:hypothetical protein